MMQVILLERIDTLGQMGDVVAVKPGYARNYLLPHGKALRATKDNVSRFETERAQLEAHNLEKRRDAEAVAEKMDGVTCVLLRQASDSDQLYGSVTAGDIAGALTDEGFTINKTQVSLDRPIKVIGLHPVRVKLHPEVGVSVTVNVARTRDEAKAQAVSGAEPEDENPSSAEKPAKTESNETEPATEPEAEVEN